MNAQDNGTTEFFSIKGVSIGLHKSFYFVGLCLLFRDGPLVQKLVWFGVLFASIFLHEMAHALAGVMVGEKPRSITLSFWGGFTEFQRPLPTNGAGALIALAGPLANLLLVVGAALGAMEVYSNGSLLAWINFFVYDFLDLGITKVSLPVGVNVLHFGDYMVGILCEKDALRYLQMIAVVNGLLAVFNLVPAFPLDGGRIFRSVSASLIGSKPAALATLIVGRCSAVALAGWCLYRDVYLHQEYMSCIIGCYIALAIWNDCYGEYFRTKMFIGAEEGDPEAEFTVGMFYLNGITVEADRERGVDWISRSAGHGYAAAQWAMALAYASGDGVVQNVDRAFDWAEKAAEQKLPDAICTLGDFYYEGLGCEKNREKAVQFYLEAANSKNEEGLYRAARCLVFEDGIAQDFGRAKEFLEEAVEKDYIPAAVELKLMCEFGLLKLDGKALNKYAKMINDAGEEAVSFCAERQKDYETKFRSPENEPQGGEEAE